MCGDHDAPHQIRQAGRAPATADPEREDDVALQDVDAAPDDEVSGLLGRPHHFTRGKPEARQSTERGVAVDVIGSQRLLQPVDLEWLERPGDLGRGRDIPAGLEVTGHPPALVGVDHDLEIPPDGVTHGFDDGHIVAPVRVVEADLDRPDAGVAKRHAPTGALVGVDELAARRVGEKALGAAAEELPDRLIRGLADEIPDRSLGDPGAAPVEVDGLPDLADVLRPERVEPDEE